MKNEMNDNNNPQVSALKTTFGITSNEKVKVNQ